MQEARPADLVPIQRRTVTHRPRPCVTLSRRMRKVAKGCFITYTGGAAGEKNKLGNFAAGTKLENAGEYSRGMSASAVGPGGRRRVAPQPPSKISTDGGGSANPTTYDALKLKYMTVDRNYETLKELTRKGTLFRV